MAERKTISGGGGSTIDEDAQAVARYLADMTGQLETMARAARLELLAYLLAMARAEAESASVESPNERR